MSLLILKWWWAVGCRVLCGFLVLQWCVVVSLRVSSDVSLEASIRAVGLCLDSECTLCSRSRFLGGERLVVCYLRGAVL
jgi:hypothetical protein